MFERNYSFYHHCCSLAVTRCSEKSNLNKPKRGAQAVVRGGARPSLDLVATALRGPLWQRLCKLELFLYLCGIFQAFLHCRHLFFKHM